MKPVYVVEEQNNQLEWNPYKVFMKRSEAYTCRNIKIVQSLYRVKPYYPKGIKGAKNNGKISSF